MVIRVQTIQVIIELITFLIAYVCTVTIAGSVRAWVAYWCGDDTAKELGFTSLNPMVHIDPMGLIFLLWFYFRWGLFFTWGRLVTLNPANFKGYLRIPKMICAYFSDTAAYFLMCLLSLTILIIMFGIEVVPLAGYMALLGVLSQGRLTEHYPDASTLSITIAFILISLMYLALFLGVLSCIINAFSLVLYIIAERTGKYELLTNPYLLILVPLIFLIFFAGPLQYIAIQVLLHTSTVIAKTFHIT